MVETVHKQVLITGGAGFIGSHLAGYLVDRGYGVSVMDNLVRRGAELNIPEFRKKGIRFFHGDIRCTEDFDRIPQDVDLLIECSAQPSVVSGYGNPRFDINNNLNGTLECLEFCRRKNAGMVFFSTNRVYSADRLNSLPIRETDTRFDYDPSNGTKIQGFDPYFGISADFCLNGGHKSIYGVSKAAADLLCQEWATAFDMPIVINRC
ncbi:MAG: NAD-dependent epimerase/dehydratase family protein, partial [Deltaproteobacteria bacterium]|nr:NAD-dependent epimerase/dehydratase family protein [Deltaproteobacteria bacterium]